MDTPPAHLLALSIMPLAPRKTCPVPRRLLAAVAFVVAFAALFAERDGVALVFRYPGASIFTSGVYIFELGPASLVTAALFLAPLLFVWTPATRRLGARLASGLLVRGGWWVWPLVAGVVGAQVLRWPWEMALWCVAAAEAVLWILWRARAAWIRSLAGVRRFLAGAEERPRLWRALGVALFAAGFAWSWGWSEFAGGARFYMSDTIAHLMHARMFQLGGLWLPAPEFPEFYRTHAMICAGGKWYSQYPPGQILAMVALDLAGAVRWLAPLTSGGVLVLVFAFGRGLYDARTAFLATTLTALSPGFALQFSEAMNHTTALFWFLAFLHAVERAAGRRTDAPGAPPAAVAARWALWAGLSAGMMFITRPLTALSLVGAWALWDTATMVLALRRGERCAAARLAGVWLAVGLGAAGPLAYLFHFNAETNGSLFTMGYIALNGPNHRLGLDWFAGNGHTARIGLMQSLNNLHALGARYLHGWPVSSFVFLLFLLLVGRPTRRDLRLLATALALSAGYFFYWYQDHFFGPRFLFEATPLYALLTARGVEALARSLAAAARASLPSARRAAWALVAILMAASLPVSYRRVFEEHVQTRNARDWAMETIDRLLDGSPRTTVFVRTRFDQWAFLRNFEPPLAPRVLIDRGDAENRRFISAHPDRDYWLVRQRDVRRLSHD